MRTQIKIRFLLLAFLLPLLLFTAGCDTGVNNTPTLTPTPKLDSAPKGPGSLALTATARATPNATTCPSLGVVSPAATTGWKTYQDSAYHFQFAVPPGWKAGKNDGGGQKFEAAAVFPQGVPFPFDATSKLPEKFLISLNISDSPFDLANDNSWKPESGTISVGKTQATLYDRSSDCVEVNSVEVDRAVVAHIAQHDYQFYLSSPFSNARQDIALFLGTLQTFSA